MSRGWLKPRAQTTMASILKTMTLDGSVVRVLDRTILWIRVRKQELKIIKIMSRNAACRISPRPLRGRHRLI